MPLKRLLKTMVLLIGAAALASLLPAHVSASTVRNVRLGLHPDHTRLVVDLSGPFTYRLDNPDRKQVRLFFKDADLRTGTRAQALNGGVVQGVRISRNANGVTINISLNTPSRANTFTWSDANRLIVELKPRPEPKVDAPKPEEEERPAEQAKAGKGPAQFPEKAAEQPQKPAVATTQKEEPLPGPATKPKQPGSAMGFFLSAQETKSPGLEMLAEEDTGKAREKSVKAQAAEEKAEPTSGVEVTRKIEPPAGLPEPKQESAAGAAPDEPPTTLGLTMRVKPKADQESGPVLMEERPATEKVKPGQVADKARELADKTQVIPKGDVATSKTIFDQGIEYFNQARYEEALQRFQNAEALSPNSSVGERALFYQADTLYKMYKQTGFPPFDQVEGAYQKAVGAFPDSTEVSRALLRMGVVNYETGNADKAKGYINLLLKEHPKAEEAVEAKVYLARLFLDENKPQQGIRLLREVVAEHPDSPQVKTALWYLGRILFEVGRYVEAFQRLTALNNGWPEFYLKEPMLNYYLGETAFRLDKLDEAREYLFKVANISPEISNMDLILTRIGETYRLQKNYKKAAVLYTEAQRRFPDSDGALIARIRLAENKGEEQGKAPKLDKVLGIELSPSASKTYQAIIDKYPERPVAQLAMLKLGALHYQNKEYEKAFEILKKLLTVYPDTEFYRDAAFALRQSFDQRMKQLAEKKETLKLISFYDSFKDNLPRELRSKYADLLGGAYFDLKLYDKAKELYQEAIKAGKKDPGVELNLALSHFQLGENQEAEAAFDAFVKAYPAHGKVNMINLYRGQVLVDLNRPEEAVAPLEKVLARGSDSRYFLPAVTLLAQTRMKMGKPDLAVEMLKGVLPKLGNQLEEQKALSILLGESLLADGRPKEAAEVLAKALQDVPLDAGHAGAYYRLGLAYLEAGKMKEAREVLNKVAGSPEQFWAKMAANRLSVADLSVQLSARQKVEEQ